MARRILGQPMSDEFVPMTKSITVDVRQDIRSGREPFSKIMAVANGLAHGEQMLVIAPFEPVPLLGVLAKKGFEHSSRQAPSGEWEVQFTRRACVVPAAVQPQPTDQSRPPGPVEVVD